MCYYFRVLLAPEEGFDSALCGRSLSEGTVTILRNYFLTWPIEALRILLNMFKYNGFPHSLNIMSSPLSKYNQQHMEEGELSSDSHSSASSEFITTTKAGRKNLCHICRAAMAKYTCPKCAHKSCSIACVRRHKTEKECDGKADLVQKVERSQIDEKVVQKDYEYVKGMLAQSDKVKKTLAGVTAATQEPKRFYYLRRHAKSEYNIKVHQAPPIIERHRENISFYYMKTKTIYWITEVLYFKGNRQYDRHLLDPTPDSKTIAEILPTEFLSQPLLLKGINTTKSAQFLVFIENRAQDKEEEGEATPGIEEIERDKQLRDALRDKNIYEYPTLIAVHESLKGAFLRWKEGRGE